jgi:hypothetical protein
VSVDRQLKALQQIGDVLDPGNDAEVCPSRNIHQPQIATTHSGTAMQARSYAFGHRRTNTSSPALAAGLPALVCSFSWHCTALLHPKAAHSKLQFLCNGRALCSNFFLRVTGPACSLSRLLLHACSSCLRSHSCAAA